ncbi:DUF2732 family protein [Hafnia paralvei]|uniref:DUF2732 family protein n=1 Tax=Hafnia paralvei TaxID=546367 RepID=UPI003C2E96DB
MPEHMKRQDLNRNTDTAQLTAMLNSARLEGEKYAADKCSMRLDKLAAEAANNGLSAAEIIELIREESASLDSKGGASWN